MLQKSTGNKILHNNEANWFYCQNVGYIAKSS